MPGPPGSGRPSAATAPGLEAVYAAAGVRRFLVDGPTLLGAATTAVAWPVGTSDVVAFGRDLDVTYRVWSPRAGYPGGRGYRDFHTYDHPLRPQALPGSPVAPSRRRTSAPYDPERAAAAVARDAADFVAVVRRRLIDLRERHGRPARSRSRRSTPSSSATGGTRARPGWRPCCALLPAAGVRVTTLRGAVDAGLVADPVELPPSSWGSGKDWRVWAGEQVADLVARGDDVQKTLVSVLGPGPTRDPVADALAQEALLALASDWAFMVSKDSAAAYARDRAATHADHVDELARLRACGQSDAARRRVAAWPAAPFGHIDVRTNIRTDVREVWDARQNGC